MNGRFLIALVLHASSQHTYPTYLYVESQIGVFVATQPNYEAHPPPSSPLTPHTDSSCIYFQAMLCTQGQYPSYILARVNAFRAVGVVYALVE